MHQDDLISKTLPRGRDQAQLEGYLADFLTPHEPRMGGPTGPPKAEDEV